jgi:adenine-specific DNA-methyltransferase
MENEKYLSEQIITYIGNKRSLLSFIGQALDIVLKETNKDKLDLFDVFSGSGIVSRYFKRYANILYTNDLEGYTKTISTCYLKNKSEVDFDKLTQFHLSIIEKIEKEGFIRGFISELYSPEDDRNIKLGERVFFTTRNALYIDTARRLIEDVPEPYKTLLLAPLLYEASNKNNTAGVFKGFYKNSVTKIGQFGGDGKNALKRILADITLELPVLSNFECDVRVFQEDSNHLVEHMPKVDLAYLDPPYNQHPYGSNYFMLNLINDYKKPTNISEVSGIPKNWNKSSFNVKNQAIKSFEELCSKMKAKYLLISFNSEGFISQEEMVKVLTKFGRIQVFEMKYNTFRGSRNLKNRNIHVKEFLFLLRKESEI